MNINSKLLSFIKDIDISTITEARRNSLQDLIEFLEYKISNNSAINLNFICTHNSRRSQLAQIWSHVASFYYGLEVSCYSGGIEVTSFNESAVAALHRAGFNIEGSTIGNTKYKVSYSEKVEPIIAFSKLYDHPDNPSKEFAAIMTCSHADENCPYIPGAEKRIPIRYDDPKRFDGSKDEAAEYDRTSLLIATEMFYVFSKIRK